jgi:hypothetical protein
MARVSIYVSDELKARMAETGDALNWSDIARPAFETAIAAFNHRKGQNMQTAIERLRASKQSEAQQQVSDGHREGRDWASNFASHSALKRLATIDTGLYDHAPGDIFGAIKQAVDPNGEHDDHDTVDSLFGDKAVIPNEWLVAWVEGVQEFFAEVEDEI